MAPPPGVTPLPAGVQDDVADAPQQVPPQAIRNPTPMQVQPQMMNIANMMQPLKIPTFSSEMTAEAYIKKLKVWIINHDHLSEPLKILKILESLKDNNERPDLKKWIVNNFEHDDGFDMTKRGVIDEFITKFLKKHEISTWNKCESCWEEFIGFKAKEGEKTRDFINRFENLESKLRNSGDKIPEMYLAIQMIRSSKVDKITKQAILTRVDQDDKTKVLSQTKKSMENIVSSLNQGNSSDTYWMEEEERGRRRYRDEDRRGRSGYSSSQGRNSGYRERGNTRSRSKHRSKSNKRGYEGQDQRYGRSGDRRNGRSNDRRSGRSNDRGYEGYDRRPQSKPRDPREVYTCENFKLCHLSILW